MKRLFVLSLALLGWSAAAYHLDDHSAVTHQAFQELVHCFPKASAMLNIEWMVQGDLDEDTNVFNKWLFYSHYYNPNKKLDMRRADSSERVGGLSTELRHPSSQGVDFSEMTSLGHLIHHLQDATVPSHAVPVEHALWDGFETYQVNDFSSGYSCAGITTLAVTEPLEILKDTAQTTLSNIQSMRFDFVSNGGGVKNRISASGSAFWLESNDNEFGIYGYLGNHFGETFFHESGVDYEIDENTYQNFKRDQMRLAVRATIRAVMWELGDHLQKLQMACDPKTIAQID